MSRNEPTRLIFLGVTGEHPGHPGRVDDGVEGRPPDVGDGALGLEAAGGRPDGRREARPWAA